MTNTTTLTADDVQYLIVEGFGITLIVNGKSHTISSSHLSYDAIIKAIQDEDYSSLPNLVDTVKSVSDYISKEGTSGVEVKHGAVYYNGQVIHGTLVDRILSYMKNGLPFNRLLKFTEKLYRNPSMNSVNQLFSFMERNNMTIAEDGDFLAYKLIRADYQSITASKIDGKTVDNSIGQTPSLPRNQIDDNPDSHCSQGLHVCAIDYLGSLKGMWGRDEQDSRVVIVKVNPENVVSVPNDYDCQKMRVSEYLVFADYQGELPDLAADTSSLYSSEDYEDDWN